jgi:hypothetical protein
LEQGATLNEDPTLEEILAADEGGKNMQKIKVEQHTFMGTVWFVGWLFTIGFLHLSFWQGALAIVVWPYYLGVHFSPIAH